MTALSSSKLNSITNRALLEWLSPMRFVSDEGQGVSKWSDETYFYVGCAIARYGEMNRVDPFGQVGFSQVSQIFQFFMLDKPPNPLKRAVSMTVDYSNFVKNRTDKLRCDRLEDLAQYLADLEHFVTDQLLPLLEFYSDPVQMVDLYRKRDETKPKSCELPVWYGFDSAMTALILARLYAPQYYEELKDRYAPIFAPLGDYPERKQRVSRLFFYLDAESLLSFSDIQ